MLLFYDFLPLKCKFTFACSTRVVFSQFESPRVLVFFAEAATIRRCRQICFHNLSIFFIFAGLSFGLQAERCVLFFFFFFGRLKKINCFSGTGFCSKAGIQTLPISIVVSKRNVVYSQSVLLNLSRNPFDLN